MATLDQQSDRQVRSHAQGPGSARGPTGDRGPARKALRTIKGYGAQAAYLSPAIKKAKPYTVQGSGERVVLVPKKPNGKTLYFFLWLYGQQRGQVNEG